jgi:transaldolase
MAHPRIEALLNEGQSVWLDDISRQMLQSGQLQRQIEQEGIRGVTSNPTIFEKAIAAGTAYDDRIAALIRQGANAGDIFEAVAVEDIANACDLFRPLYDATNGGDGFVSIEVAPQFARDTEGTLREVRRLWGSVDRPNLLVKIPGTAEGAPAIRTALAEGININITLLFSIFNYERVARAYVEALEERLNRGRSVDRIASVASFFVSRVDTLVDTTLDAKIADTDDAGTKQRLTGLKGKVAVANAKLAYAKFQDIFGGQDFARLREAGAKVQRPLCASTGTKNPAYSDVLYVETLIGPDTVNTMPGKTIEAFLDHGEVRRTVDEGVDESHEIMVTLAAHGIELDDLTAQLEEEGIASFQKSFDALLAGVEGKRAALAETVAAS